MNSLMFAAPLFFAFLLDALIGDPQGMPHPVRAIGALIERLEKLVRRYAAGRSPDLEGGTDRRNPYLRSGGAVLAVTAVIVCTGIPAALLLLCGRIHPAVRAAAETVLMFTLLAGKSLKDETMKVYRALEADDLEGARQAVSMVVGRDTSVLDRDGITRAAVETIAENTSDGVTAPLMYMALFGAAGGFFYKTVNTMDSMIGYRNEKYRDIGCFAAKLDDVLNWIPSRLTALFMIGAAYLCGYDGKGARRIWRRDRRRHASPNSAQTESVCAGALGIRLAGDAVYFGEVYHKPYIGDDTRSIEPADIARANRLMQVTSVLVWMVCLVLRAAIGTVL